MRLPFNLSAFKSLALCLFAVIFMFLGTGGHAWAQDSRDIPSNQKLARDSITSIPIGQQGIYYKVDGTGKLRPVGTATGIPTAPADGPAIDAFGRLRVSNSETIFNHKNITSKGESVWEERTVGAGAIAFNGNAAAVDLTLGTGATDSAVRQTGRYISYIPGKGQRITQSFIRGPPKTGVNFEVGYGDDLNGIFIGQDGLAEPKWFIRSNTSGSPVETSVLQSSWNIDTLDGSGDDGNPSGILLDLTKAQLSFIDFQWQGVGRVRTGLIIGGLIVTTHEFNHANVSTDVFMRNPSLPARYKIYNTEITASATTLQEICTAIESEGGFVAPGLEFTALADQVETNWRATSTTRTPIFAVRMLNTVNGFPNRKTLRFLDAGFFATGNNVIFEVVHIHDPSAITATWTAVGGGSVSEYSEDITAITGTPSHVIDPQAVAAGQAGKGTGDVITAGIINEHSFVSQDFESDNSQVFVIYATSTVGAGTGWSHLTWGELD